MAAPFKIRRRLLHCEKGMAALEFILIAPALFTLIFTIVVCSFYFMSAMAVRQAAAEGARAAVAGLSIPQRESLATERANAVIDAYGALLSGDRPSVAPTYDIEAGTFTVTVNYNFKGNALYEYLDPLLPMQMDLDLVGKSVVTNGSY